MDKNNNSLKIGDLSRLTGIRQSTIKYYSELGLIPFEKGEGRLARRYNLTKATKRLKEIEKLKLKRLRIDEILEHFKRAAN